jgi:hypothetical protein
LHERTKNKVSIYGSDSAAWKAAILQDVDAAQLPVFYGGTMTDPDGNPQCMTKVSCRSHRSLLSCSTSF